MNLNRGEHMKNKFDPIGALLSTSLWSSILLPTGVLFAVWYGSVTASGRSNSITSVILLFIALITVSIPLFLFIRAYLTMYRDCVIIPDKTQEKEQEVQTDNQDKSPIE